MESEYVIFDENNVEGAPVFRVTQVDKDGYPTLTGNFFFTFDKKKVFNVFRDYPRSLTAEQKQAFDENFSDWANLLASMVHA